ncbi:tissue factor pathway inhibitor 2 isoform X2 [Heptranchias perlo]|uniref:tissue factor pathway inhibitor 2 isoform X2 n=1 Tax=Heptranchias perlo TaxID=212740 RepID=UPI00355A4BCD
MELKLFPLICGIFLLAPQCGMALQDNREICLLLPKRGPCRALFPRFYYNRYTQTCEPFQYGGCKGNLNNFETLKLCSSHCQGIKKVPKTCRLEADTGPCRASFTRYFYNFTTGQCERFSYGGCYGNDNNFRNMFSCHQKCEQVSLTPSFCTKPKDKGSCTADILRFYYSQETSSCETFSYSGCGGNDNNFVSLRVCQKICQPPGNRKAMKNKEAPAAPSYKIIRTNQRRKQFLKNPKMIN